MPPRRPPSSVPGHFARLVHSTVHPLASRRAAPIRPFGGESLSRYSRLWPVDRFGYTGIRDFWLPEGNPAAGIRGSVRAGFGPAGDPPRPWPGSPRRESEGVTLAPAPHRPADRFCPRMASYSNTAILVTFTERLQQTGNARREGLASAKKSPLETAGAEDPRRFSIHRLGRRPDDRSQHLPGGRRIDVSCPVIFSLAS